MSVSATDVLLYTEDFPPYNYLGQDGQARGLAVTNVQQVLDDAGLSYSIKVVPWARAMYLAQTETNVLIFTIARTPTREAKFDWLVPLFRSEFHLYARAEKAAPVSVEELRQGKYVTTCVGADASCEILSWLGVPSANIIEMPNQGALDVQMVLAGRADLYFGDRAANDEQLKRWGVPRDAVTSVMQLDYNGGFFLAAGRQVDAMIRDRVRASYERLEQADLYHIIEDPPARD